MMLACSSMGGKTYQLWFLIGLILQKASPETKEDTNLRKHLDSLNKDCFFARSLESTEDKKHENCSYEPSPTRYCL